MGFERSMSRSNGVSEKYMSCIAHNNSKDMILYVLKRGDAPVIDTVDFAVLSTEDVLAQSVVEVTETSLYTRGVPTTNGLNDLR